VGDSCCYAICRAFISTEAVTAQLEFVTIRPLFLRIYFCLLQAVATVVIRFPASNPQGVIQVVVIQAVTPVRYELAMLVGHAVALSFANYNNMEELLHYLSAVLAVAAVLAFM
jgi:hypothetical protein